MINYLFDLLLCYLETMRNRIYTNSQSKKKVPCETVSERIE